jgi:erythromycin esterase-like protein
MRAVIDYLDRTDPAAARVARERYGCLTPWQNDPATYGRAVLSAGYAKCEPAVVAMLRDLFEKQMDYERRDAEGFFDATQNARLVAAERYCRIMYYGATESWNLRDRHMFETLERLLAWRGQGSKAVVWAHNSHIGDARATDMGERGEINIGQLCRERFAEVAVVIGFGTDRGTVAGRHPSGTGRWRSSRFAPRITTATSGSAARAASLASWRICGKGALPSCAAPCFILDWSGRSA